MLCDIEFSNHIYYTAKFKCLNTHTHTRLTALCLGLLRWAGTRKVKPIWILLKQQTVSGSGISWAVCKFAHRSRQITMPSPHHSVFYRPDALPATQPTVSKALKALNVSTRSWIRCHITNYYYYYTCLAASFPGQPSVSRYQKGKTSLNLYQARNGEVLGCSGISWTICKQSAAHSRQITTPTPLAFNFYSSSPPTNSVKALKAMPHY